MQGTLLDGRFRVDDPIRCGVLFDVHAGRDLKSKDGVIVKVLRGSWAEERELVARLKAGLGELRDLAYMGVAEVRCADGILTEGLIPYVVRARAVGEAAQQLLGRMGDQAEVLNRVAQKLAAAIRKIHSWGMVHGGLHADNVYIASDGTTTIADLGTSELALLPPAFLRDGRCLVLPPEVRRQPRPPQPSDDIYAWGAVMYGLLMGDLPERACDRELMRGMQDRYQGFGLDVIRRAFHEDPAARYRDAESLYEAVRSEFRVVPVRPDPAPAPRATPAAPAPVPPAARAVAAPGPERPPVDAKAVDPRPGAGAASVPASARPPGPQVRTSPASAPAPKAAEGKTAAEPREASAPRPEAAAKGDPALGKLRGELVRRHAVLAGQTYHDMLDVKRDATQDEIRLAFHSLARRFHPDRLGNVLPEADRKVAQSLFESYSEAYGVLSDETHRRGYELDLMRIESAARSTEKAIVVEGNRDRRVVADEYMRDALALASRGDFWGAAQTVRQALLIDPLRPAFHLDLGRFLSRLPKWRKDAEKALLRALELEPGASEAHYLLGSLYQGAGLEARAAEQFKKALALDPVNDRYRQAVKGGP